MKTLICSLSLGLLAASSAIAQEKAPYQLTWQNYDKVAAYASEKESEKLYHTIDWKDTVLEAQQQAYKQDKPIVMILFFGDHRANC